MEDFSENLEEIPMINLNMRHLLRTYKITWKIRNMELAEGDMSKALVALTWASIPTPKLKNVSQLRIEQHV